MGKSLVTGIDIGHHSIKAAVLKPMGDTYALVGMRSCSLPLIFSPIITRSIIRKL